MKSDTIDGGKIEIGIELDGAGKRIYINGEDRTNDVVQEIGPRLEDGHGIPLPRGNAELLAQVKMLIRNGEL